MWSASIISNVYLMFSSVSPTPSVQSCCSCYIMACLTGNGSVCQSFLVVLTQLLVAAALSHLPNMAHTIRKVAKLCSKYICVENNYHGRKYCIKLFAIFGINPISVAVENRDSNLRLCVSLIPLTRTRRATRRLFLFYTLDLIFF